MQNEERILQILTDMQQDMTGLKQDITGVKQDITGVKQDITGVKQDITGVRQDITGLKQSMASFDDRMTSFEDCFEEQKSIILNLENTFGRRLDALTDGFLLNKEKNELLERRVDSVEVRVGRLEIAAG